MKKVIDKCILPYFREEDYSRGIVLGTQAIIDVLSGPRSARSPVKSSNQYPGDGDGFDLVAFIGILGLVAVGVGALFVIDRLRYGSFFARGRTGSSLGIGGTPDFDDDSDTWSSFDDSGGSSDSGGCSGGGGATGDW